MYELSPAQATQSGADPAAPQVWPAECRADLAATQLWAGACKAHLAATQVWPADRRADLATTQAPGVDSGHDPLWRVDANRSPGGSAWRGAAGSQLP